MTESQFIEENKESWEKLERLLKLPVKDADKLNDLFVKVSGDLSYARTFFPNRSVRLYLNNLTQEVYDNMRIKQKKTGWDQFMLFFKEILPFEIYQSRYALLVSLLVFSISMGIGIFSCVHNPEFPTLILGEDYISMTEDNIAKGDPMAVYKDSDSMGMFLGISTNNIRVAFLAFVLGFIGSIGTIFVLITNGIMVGAFQFFFYQKGLFLTSFLTIWIHGTIEISSIIIAGGAGIVLGNGLLFPNTYNRSTSLRISGQRALRIILGTIPLFILAALLESYVTRLTELPDSIKWFIIILSAVIIISYFILFPWFKKRQGHFDENEHLNIVPHKEEVINAEAFVHRDSKQVFSVAFAYFRTRMANNLKTVLLPLIFLTAAVLWYKLSQNPEQDFTEFFADDYINPKHGGWAMIAAICFAISYGLMSIFHQFKKATDPRFTSAMVFIKKYGAFIILCTCIYLIPLYYIEGFYKLIFFIFIPPHILFTLLAERVDKEKATRDPITDSIGFAFSNWPSFFLVNAFSVFAVFLIWTLMHSSLVGIVTEFISWHGIFDSARLDEAFISNLIKMFSLALVLPLMVYLSYFQYTSLICRNDARDLQNRMDSFGTKSNKYE